MRKIYLILVILFCAGVGFAQNPEIKSDMPTIIPPSPSVAALMRFEEVPVNNYTGIPDVSIPLFSSRTRSKDINLDISLKYHPSGVVFEERATVVGLGWSLFAGGSISRTVRGLPDEISDISDKRMGLYQDSITNYKNNYYEVFPYIRDYSEDNFDSIPTGGYDKIDEYMWNSHVRGMFDAEHDLWQFNFMGQSGRFYIRKNSSDQLEVVPLDDYRVTIINNYGVTGNKYKPTSFVVFDDKGYKYVFDVVETTTTHSTNHGLSALYGAIGPTSTSSYTYQSSFHLSMIYDNAGNPIMELDYHDAMMESTMNSVITQNMEDVVFNGIPIAFPGSCGSDVLNFNPYPDVSITATFTDTNTKKLEQLRAIGIAKVDFLYSMGRSDNNYENAASCYALTGIEVKDWNETIIRKIAMEHVYSVLGHERMILDKVIFTDPDETEEMEYGLYYRTPSFPYGDSLPIGVDYWGYYNLEQFPDIYPDMPYRESHPDLSPTETLQKMVLPTGGCVIYDFQANTYSYIGDEELEDYSANPSNWDNHEVGMVYNNTDTDPYNDVIQLSGTHREFFEISEAQEVFFTCELNTVTGNADYWVKIYKVGTTPHVGGTVLLPTDADYNSRFFSLPLDPGEYEIEVFHTSPGSTDLISASFHAFFKTLNTNNYKFLYGGGNRIGRIGYFKDGDVAQTYYQDGDDTPLPDKEVKYQYHPFGSLSESSGSLTYAMPTFRYTKDKREFPYCLTVGHPSGNPILTWKNDEITYRYNVVTSFNNLNPIKTQGADVGYKNVTVSQKNNGKTEYTYKSPIDVPETIGVLNLAPPFLPTENFDYKRGLLEKEEVFNQAGNTLKVVEYGYDYEDYIEITGMKLYYSGTDFANTYGHTTYLQYKTFIESCDEHPLFLSTNCNHHILTSSCDCFAYFGTPKDFISAKPVKEAYGWAKLTSKSTKDYFPGSSPLGVVQVDETYTYNPLNKKIDEATKTNSLGEILKTKYYYHAGNAPDHYNRISEIEKIEAYRDTDLLSTSKIIYSDAFSGNASFLPQYIQTAKASLSPENRVKYTLYDGFGNPLELQQEGGTPVSYIWGYNRSQPVAKIENATNADIATALSVSLSGVDESDMAAIDGLRTSLPEAMVTTYTYIPLVGVSSITDPKGDKITYEYDGFGRLERVRDRDNKILSENEYQYMINGDPLNFVQTTTYKTESATTLTSPTAAQAAINRTYFDGLGRPVQQIAHKQAGDAKDIVTHIQYDLLGRQPLEYLPYVNSTASLDYNEDARTDLLAYPDYLGNYPYSEKMFEASPLNRVLKQGAPGEEWQVNPAGADHTIKFDYRANKEDVKKYIAVSTWDPDIGLFDIALVQDDDYVPNELYKTSTKDENWTIGDENTTQEFRDKQGRVILKRTFGVSVVDGTEGETAHDTYYVYDQYGNLSYVIPPLADDPTDTPVMEGLCYQYKYDYRNRLVEKKLPGRQWEHIVYDKLDRVVAAGPALSPFDNINPDKYGWLLTKYDALGRNVLTAWLQADFSSEARASLQFDYDTTVDPLYETRTSPGETINNVDFDYTNVSFPTSGYHVLSVNYFDDYDYPGAPATFTTVMDDNSQAVYYNNSTHKPKGLATGSWVRICEQSTTNPVRANVSHMLYDGKGRVVRSRTDDYLTGHTQTDSKIDFSGKVQQVQTTHQHGISGPEVVVYENFSYSDQDRLLAHTHKIGGGGTVHLLAYNEYDKLGRLVGKQVGGEDVTTFVGLQHVDYKYNIRGWLTDINDAINLVRVITDPIDLFNFHINYNTAYPETNYTGTPLYNGNIAETYWRSDSDNVLRKYGYEYDALNRLKNAIYQKPENDVAVTNSYDESLTYDRNGNIVTLDRYGDLDTELLNIKIDELAYITNGNQLVRVSDSTEHPEGFTDDASPDTTDDYTYDGNGNMTSDDNKGITGIRYNHLNLPTEIVFTGTNKKINYLYDATGIKVKKTVTDNTDVTVTDYLSGFQYEKVGSGDIELKFFPHEEGYVNNTVIDSTNVYNYVYQYKDHLGNIRMTYTWDDIEEELVILEENHYYPFGMKHGKYNSETWAFIKGGIPVGISIGPSVDLPYQYKYNSKEWQDELSLNVYDYHARLYDPASVRTLIQDPLSEKFYSMSPYSFLNNNPVRFVDPDGKQSRDFEEIDRNGNSNSGFNDGPQYIASTVVDKRGKIIDHKDDGDDNIYLNKRGGLVVGKERKEVEYTPGKTVARADLLKDFNYTDGLITDISRINAEKKASKNPNARIANCPLCSSRRCNGASHTSVTRAAKAGYNGMTTAGGLGYGAAAWWVEGATTMGGVIGLFGAFVPGYMDDAHAQYTEYNTQLQEAQKEKDED